MTEELARPVRKYGIYLAYPPTVDLRDQGLGRHLAMLLRGAEEISDVRFVIVCPSWSADSLGQLFKAEQVSSDLFEIVSPAGTPYILRCFEALKNYRKRRARVQSVWRRAFEFFKQAATKFLRRLSVRVVSIHSLRSLLRFTVEIALALTALIFIIRASESMLPAIVLVSLVLMTYVISVLFVSRRPYFRRFLDALAARTKPFSAIFRRPQRYAWVISLFDEMLAVEVRRMHTELRALQGVHAWYCPTAFWPSFNEIDAPRLLCVPDVVLADFPVGFTFVNGEGGLRTFEAIARTIGGGQRFVTYSDTVKWETLNARFSVPAANVTVIRHASCDLSPHVSMSGFADGEATSELYCQALLRGALMRSANRRYVETFQNMEVKFLFYASQFRPNKNVLTLLRAFDHLLRKRFLGYKLFLTGDPGHLPEVGEFVTNRRLGNDVIFMPGLSVSELSACYKLAALAVNPSLSEGGCPFTFSEALSVGTPVVMSKISVSEEVLDDPVLQEATFFDPYDWYDCASKIEWAVSNRGELLAIQRRAYEKLSQRRWADVASEHIQILDQISGRSDA